MSDFGGELHFSVNGNPLILRTKFESEPVNMEFDGGANQDNSIYRTLKPTGYTADMTFQDQAPNIATALDWSALMRAAPGNMTLVEPNTNRLHMWTQASFEGKPRVDHTTGEVTGIKIRAVAYKKTTA